MILPRCDNCIFWAVHSSQSEEHPDDQEGTCRRYPPVLVDCLIGVYAVEGEDEPSEISATMIPWMQPVITGHNWCGEYKCAHSSAEAP